MYKKMNELNGTKFYNIFQLLSCLYIIHFDKNIKDLKNLLFTNFSLFVIVLYENMV